MAAPPKRSAGVLDKGVYAPSYRRICTLTPALPRKTGPEDSMSLAAAVQPVPASGMVSEMPCSLDLRTRRLLEAPIAGTLLRLALPNVAVMLAQASTGLIETWWVSLLGINALAGMALVFPMLMMMQMLSAGAMGGGISS